MLLFDEIEKAHPDVFNIFLQILDDGRLTDGKGRTVDFKNTVIIMTSNIASTYIHEAMNGRGGEEPAVISEVLKKRIHEALLEHFRPEFLNRIDEIVIFNPLGKENIKKIIELQLGNLKNLLAERKIQIELTPQGARTALPRRLRSAVRSASAEARHPTPDPGPAGHEAPGRRGSARRNGGS